MKPSVVVGYDESPQSELAVDVAAAEAARRGAELIVVHATRHVSAEMPPYEIQMPVPGAEYGGEPASQVAEQGAERARAGHPGLPVQARDLVGGAAQVLADLSSEADLMVVGHRGRGGFAGLQLGSVAVRTVGRSSCPIMVVRGDAHRPRPLGTVLAAVDLGDATDEILDFAFAEATQRGARLRAISVLEILWPRASAVDTGQLSRTADQVVERANAALERLLQAWRAKYPDVPTEHEVVEGSPAAVVTAATGDADLVVAGARRRGDGLRIGPVAHVLLLHAECPVAVVPHD